MEPAPACAAPFHPGVLGRGVGQRPALLPSVRIQLSRSGGYNGDSKGEWMNLFHPFAFGGAVLASGLGKVKGGAAGGADPLLFPKGKRDWDAGFWTA